MKNYFALTGDELVQYHKDLNMVCNEFTYNGYKFFYNLVEQDSVNADDIASVLDLTRPWFVDDNIYEEYCSFYKFYENAIDDIIEDHLVDEGIDEEDKMFDYDLYHEYKTIEVDDQYISFIDHYSGAAGQYWEEMVKDISILPKINLHIVEYVENIVNSARKNPSEINYWLEKLPMTGEYDTVVHEHIDALCYAIKHNKEYEINYNIIDLCDHYIMNKESYKFG